MEVRPRASHDDDGDINALALKNLEWTDKLQKDSSEDWTAPMIGVSNSGNGEEKWFLSARGSVCRLTSDERWSVSEWSPWIEYDQ